MLNHIVSIDEGARPVGLSTALVPLSPSLESDQVDPELRERISRAAAASGSVPPMLFPGAAALILPVSLPVKSARQRVAALPFAVEEHLAEPVEQVALGLGPCLGGDTWLCVAVNRDKLRQLTSGQDTAGPVMPDTLAVPMPDDPKAWSVWCGADTIHIRTADGAGFATSRNAFADVWRAFGAPRIDLLRGLLPPGLSTAREIDDVPEVDPAVFQLDLRGEGTLGLPSWRSAMARFACIVLMVTGLGHVALTRADAVTLDRLAQERTVLLQDRLDAMGLAVDASAAPQLIRSRIAALSSNATRDEFLPRLLNTLAAMPDDPSVTFRDLRYDAASDTLTILLQASDLAALQAVESALLSAGLTATGGAATRQASGAEMQIVIVGAT